MQAIRTRYLAPTNTRGGRIRASCDAGAATVPWDHALDTRGNHERAARALRERLGWPGIWVCGFCGSDAYHVQASW